MWPFQVTKTSELLSMFNVTLLNKTNQRLAKSLSQAPYKQIIIRNCAFDEFNVNVLCFWFKEKWKSWLSFKYNYSSY
jgi:hypothetical protein